MRPFDFVRPAAKTALLVLGLCTGLATASHSSPLLLDFDTAPNGVAMPVGTIDDAPINDLFDYVGVTFSFDVLDTGPGSGVQNDHLCNGSTPWDPADGDSVWAGPPRSVYGDSSQNVISPCRPTHFPDFSANFGNLHTIFDRPVVKMCVNYLFASSEPNDDPYIAVTELRDDRIGPVEDGLLCVEGDDISWALVSTQSTKVFFDNFEITYDPDWIDFDLDLDGHYIGGDAEDVSERINATYESRGVSFRMWEDGVADCGESSNVPGVYVRNERAADDIGSAANTVTLNESDSVPMTSSNGWIEADLSNATHDDVVCIDFSTDGSQTGEATLSAFGANGGFLVSDNYSLASGEPAHETLCVQVADIECVRFRANSGEVYFDNLVIEALPEPASGLLGFSSILAIAGLRRFRSYSRR